MSTDGINLSTEEQYEDPKLGGSFLFSEIGHAQYKQAWDCGSASDDCEVDGVKYGKGQRIYIVAKRGETGEQTKARANEAKKANTRSKYLNRVALISMPLASVTNKSDESKSKSKYPVSNSAARVSAIDPKKDLAHEGNANAVGIQLITIPSMVDAFARYKGWYAEPLFDSGAVSGIGENKNRDATEDALFCIPTLVAMRTAIWAALGESNWMAMYEDTKSEKLSQALKEMYRTPWDGWVEFAQLPDPSSEAFYESTKEVEDDNGEKRFPKKRQRVPVILAFFKGEKDAVEEGKKRIAEREGGEASANGKDKYIGLFDKLSPKGKKTCNTADTWVAVADAIASELATNAKPVDLAKEYDVELKDVLLVKNA